MNTKCSGLQCRKLCNCFKDSLIVSCKKIHKQSHEFKIIKSYYISLFYYILFIITEAGQNNFKTLQKIDELQNNMKILQNIY